MNEPHPAEDLIWSVLFLMLGAAVVVMWTAPVSTAVLWAGYIGLGTGIGYLIRWFLRVVR